MKKREEPMPMEKKRYPQNWRKIAFEIKQAAGWKCQVCGKQCRRPGEPFDTHKRTLTVAHLNHTPEDVRPENLKAMCAPCHLRYDAQHHAETRKARRDGWKKITYNIHLRITDGELKKIHEELVAAMPTEENITATPTFREREEESK